MLDPYSDLVKWKTKMSVRDRYKMITDLANTAVTKENREALLKPNLKNQFFFLPLRYLTHMMCGEYQTVPIKEFESGTLERMKFLALNATTLLQCEDFNGKYSNHDILRSHLSWNMKRTEIGPINQVRSTSTLSVFNIMVFLAKKGYDYNQIVALYNPEIISEEANIEVDKIIANRARIFCVINKCSYILLFTVGSLVPASIAYALGASEIITLGVGICSLGLVLASTCLYLICKSYDQTCKFPCPDCRENFADVVKRNYANFQENLAVKLA